MFNDSIKRFNNLDVVNTTGNRLAYLDGKVALMDGINMLYSVYIPTLTLKEHRHFLMINDNSVTLVLITRDGTIIIKTFKVEKYGSKFNLVLDLKETFKTKGKVSSNNLIVKLACTYEKINIFRHYKRGSKIVDEIIIINSDNIECKVIDSRDVNYLYVPIILHDKLSLINFKDGLEYLEDDKVSIDRQSIKDVEKSDISFTMTINENLTYLFNKDGYNYIGKKHNDNLFFSKISKNNDVVSISISNENILLIAKNGHELINIKDF